MILQSHVPVRWEARSNPGRSRARVGVIMLTGVVAVLALLNVLAGAA